MRFTAIADITLGDGTIIEHGRHHAEKATLSIDACSVKRGVGRDRFNLEVDGHRADAVDRGDNSDGK